MTFTPAEPTPLSSLPTNVDIRLVAVDMDGTLLGDDKKIPEQLWPMLAQLAQRGVTFAPSSGRQCWTLIDMFERVGEGLTVIAENGAIVMRDGKEVSSVPMDHETVAEVVRRVRSAVAGGINAGLMMCGKASGYVERFDQPFMDSVLPYYHRTAVVDDQLDVLARIGSGELDDDIIKLAVFCFDAVQPIAEVALEPFASTHQYVVSGYNWADLQTAGVDKGAAVTALQEYLGVTREQTLAFGDFHNDLGMLAAAKWSFAMANAHPDVVEAARYIAPSNNDGGVFTVTRHLLGL
ncbi:Cof-type HAD-IIB family hydrolase [Schaalia suimastitidis]|uniref:Cof-type HAD-IIB family hydrolase n=1 Tax=Schaalia suimastitidis TaxID=121163 RepID=UPI00040327E6|nr:Cof-type HAD-IIB family hydrolase [Schaalia suimastitidis]